MKIHPLILVIDDESKIRRFVCQSLEREGFDVASAGDGEEALEVLKHFQKSRTWLLWIT